MPVRPARSTNGRSPAASTISTASWMASPIGIIRNWCRTTLLSNRQTGLVITYRSIWWIMRSPTFRTSPRRHRTSRSYCTLHSEPRMRRTRFHSLTSINYVPVFEKGWDQTRLDRLARQKQLGIAPADTELTPRNPGVKPWNDLPNDEKRLYVRYQAAFAGFLEHTDEQIGRLTDYLRATGKLDNTVLVLISDNGANPEGGLEGTTNALSEYLNVPTTFKHDLAEIDKIGTDRSFSNYPRGWAMAGNTPFRLYKEFVDAGGVNDPLIIHWPKGINT